MPDSLYYHFSRQLPCFFICVTTVYANFLALTVSNGSLFTPALLRTHSFVFFAVHETRRIFHLKGVKTCFFILSESPAFTAVYVATLALSLVVSSLKSVCCDFSIFSVPPIARPLFNLQCCFFQQVSLTCTATGAYHYRCRLQVTQRGCQAHN